MWKLKKMILSSKSRGNPEDCHILLTYNSGSDLQNAYQRQKKCKCEHDTVILLYNSPTTHQTHHQYNNTCCDEKILRVGELVGGEGEVVVVVDTEENSDNE